MVEARAFLSAAPTGLERHSISGELGYRCVLLRAPLGSLH
jgi:hypothetical protein